MHYLFAEFNANSIAQISKRFLFAEKRVPVVTLMKSGALCMGLDLSLRIVLTKVVVIFSQIEVRQKLLEIRVL